MTCLGWRIIFASVLIFYYLSYLLIIFIYLLFYLFNPQSAGGGRPHPQSAFRVRKYPVGAGVKKHRSPKG